MKAVSATVAPGSARPRAQSRPAAVYKRIRNILESARDSASRSVNSAQVIANWMIGREIVEDEQQGSARAGYADQLIPRLSQKLTADYGSGYSAQSLAYMKQFYLTYPTLLAPTPDTPNIFHALRGKSSSPAIFHALRGKFTTSTQAWNPGHLHHDLSWTHYRTLLRVPASSARGFYEIEAVRHAWSARELERQIDSLLFERLAKSRDKKGLLRLASEGHRVTRPLDIFKDPLVIEFLGIPESHRLVESDLEQALIANLQAFLLELGKGFAFVARQQRITLDGDHFYVDLVFYHTILKCFVLIDLKVGKLTHADLGQMQFYANYFDRERLTDGDNPTLGLILCSHKNEAVVRYTLGEQQTHKISTSRYQVHLPTEEELQNEMRREMRELSPVSAVKKSAVTSPKKTTPLKKARS